MSFIEFRPLDFFITFFPFTGIFVGCFFLFRIPSLYEQWGVKSPLEKHVIFYPIHKTKIFLIYLTSDIIWKLIVLLKSVEFSEHLALIVDYIPLVFFSLLYILCDKILPNVEIRNVRKVSASVNYDRLGMLLSLIMLTVFVASMIIQQKICWYDDERKGFVLSIICLLSGSLICIKVYSEFKRNERVKKEAERTIRSLITHRAPIILLRSFEIDKFVLKGYTFDEYICKSFSMTSQPILSLSDPDDFLPTGGSIKIQSCDLKWKEAIISLIENCRAVVIFEGRSEGLQWEIENIKHYVAHDKLFVATPPQKYRKAVWCRSFINGNRRKSLSFLWKQFANHLEKEGFSLPYSDPGGNALFSFDKKWNAKRCDENGWGASIFDYILDTTVKYEKTEYDYQRLATELSSYELSKNPSAEDKRKINQSVLIIACSFVFVMVLIALLF